MLITVNCLACGQQFRTKDEHAGKRGKCSKCGQVLVIPGHPKTVAAAKDAPSVPANRNQPARQAKPTLPRIATHVGSLVAVTAFFDSASGWSLLGSRHQLPFSWLRRFIYDKLGWVGGGMFFEDALASILHGAGSPETMDASLPPESRRIPPGASAAVQLATGAGFLTTPIIDCLELKRFQVSFQDFQRPTLRGLLLSPFAWLAILCVAVYLLLPAWGMKWICRYFPALRSRIAGWYTKPQTWPRLALLPLLWLAGLFAGVLCITLFIYTIFWPPLFLRLLAKTGDYILVTADSLIFYSAFDQTAAKVPRSWPLLQGRRGKHYVILDNERNTFGSVVPVCVARLPAEWADGLDLNVECPGRFLGHKIHTKARLLHEQVLGQTGQN